jgi:2-methylcitrate dehydratase PrpD
VNSTAFDIGLLHLADLLAVSALARRHASLPDFGSDASTDAGGIGPLTAFAMEAATAGHWFDWDDVLVTGAVHPGVMVLPALAAVSHVRSITALEAAGAFISAVARVRSIAAAFASDHAGRGWHATATIGRIAAAEAAAAHLHPSDEGAAWRAGRIAAGSASGFTDVFGSSLKPLQVGAAAASAASAAWLAGEVRDVPDLLTPGTRFAGLLGVERAVTGPPGEPDDIEIQSACRALRVKKFPICFYAHPVVLAAQRVLEGAAASVGGDFDDVGEVLLRVSPACARTCDAVSPKTLDEVRFSLPTLVAAIGRPASDGLLGLLDGSILDADGAARQTYAVRIEIDEALAPFEAEVYAAGKSSGVDLGVASEVEVHTTRAEVIAKARLVGGAVGRSIEMLSLGDPEETSRPLHHLFQLSKETR